MYQIDKPAACYSLSRNRN